VDIPTLKEEARALEQQGRTAEALSLYRKTLARLEGTPGILRELPLYVKAGDLNLKLGDSKAAISMYERAAKRYAQYGSSKSVIALCSKILRVAPVKTYVYLSLARMMIERGHVGEAGKVLAIYAERVSLGKAQEVVQGLADVDVDKAQPVLEMLLEVAGRAEGAKLKSAGLQDDEERQGETAGSISSHGRESQQEHSATENESEPEDQEESEKDSSAWPEQRQLIDIPNLVRGSEPVVPAEPMAPEEPVAAGEQEPTGIEQREEQQTQEADAALGYAPAPGSGKHSAVEVPDEDADSDFSPTIEPPPREEPGDSAQREPVGEEPAARSPWAPPREEPAARAAKRAEPMSRTGARPPLTFTTVKPKSSKPVWLWVALGAVVIGGGGGLVLSGVLGGNGDEPSGEQGGEPAVAGGASEPAAVAAVADSAIQQGQSDSIAGLTEDSAGALMAEQRVSGATDTGLAAMTPLDLPQGLGDSLLQAVPQIQPETGITDAAQTETATDSAAPLQSLPPGVQISGPIVVIQGLVIESVTEFPAGGHRVVLLLDSGEPLALMSIPIAGDSVDATTADQITVREVPGDTAVGTVSFGRYNVNVRGRVAVEVLRTLLGRLVVREP
jgi:tetratricopeptide (TPR) repeat protein